MDPRNRRPKEYGPVDDRGPGGQLRISRLVVGDHVLTVNPVDGSEVEPCPPGEPRGTPRRRTAEEHREFVRTVTPPVPAGAAATAPHLVEREEERGRITALLAGGSSVRLTGRRGTGRSALLNAVATDCAEFAPDGVIRLSGYHRTPTDLLHTLFAAVHWAPQHRLDREELLEAVGRIGAVVVIDDLEFGGTALDELLDATPECAYLIAATPDVPGPSADGQLAEITLPGLSRTACLELLEHLVRRPLADEESDWAADLWFESEGLPLRFVQAGALLRQRDALRADPEPDSSVFADGNEDTLPTLGDGIAPAVLLADRLSETARETLRFAVALEGELPHQVHLPALVNDTSADGAVSELLARGLVTVVGAHYRLADGVRDQLTAAGYDEGAAERTRAAAQHYTWWAGHPSVTPGQVAAEADALLSAIRGTRQSGGPSTAVLLARSAAPAFAAALHWSAWERALRGGQEAARLAGEVAEEAYFHHELGVLALCTGNIGRARAELEASIALRGVLSDRRGAVAGRRALALVDDLSLPSADGTAGFPALMPPAPLAALPPGGSAPATGTPAIGTGSGGTGSGAGGPVKELGLAAAAGSDTVRTPRPPLPPVSGARGLWLKGARRNLVAVGAGAVLVAVLGTVTALSGASGEGEDRGDSLRPDQSSSQPDDDGDLVADEPVQRRGSGSPSPSASPSGSERPSASPSAAGEGPVMEIPQQSPDDGVPSSPPQPTAEESPEQSPTGSAVPAEPPDSDDEDDSSDDDTATPSETPPTSTGTESPTRKTQSASASVSLDSSASPENSSSGAAPSAADGEPTIM